MECTVSSDGENVQAEAPPCSIPYGRVASGGCPARLLHQRTGETRQRTMYFCAARRPKVFVRQLNGGMRNSGAVPPVLPAAGTGFHQLNMEFVP